MFPNAKQKWIKLEKKALKESKIGEILIPSKPPTAKKIMSKSF